MASYLSCMSDEPLYMLISRGQGLQLVDGFANRVQRQKAVFVMSRIDYRKPGLKTGVKKDI